MLQTDFFSSLPIVRVRDTAYLPWEDRFSGASGIHVLEGDYAPRPALTELLSVPDLFVDRVGSFFEPGPLADRYASLERVARDVAFDEAKRSGSYDALAREVHTITAQGRCTHALLTDAIHALAVPLTTYGELDDVVLDPSGGVLHTIRTVESRSYGFELPFVIRERRVDPITPRVLVEYRYAIVGALRALGPVAQRTLRF